MSFMVKNCCVIIFLFIAVSSFSQISSRDSAVNYSKSYIDSLLSNNDSLLKEFNAFVDSITGNKSYFDFSTGIGNRLFSLRNNAFNTQQVSTNKLTLTPTLSYINKTGLGLSWTSFLVFDGSKTGFVQHALTPSYDFLKSDKVGFGISYTRYFINSANSFSATPFQNEVFAYVTSKTGWVQPGLSIGWAKGNYKETFEFTRIIDTVINGQYYQLKRIRRDTIKTNLTDFSLTGTVKHEFEWHKIFGKKDGISLTPTLIIIAGAQNYKVAQTTAVNGLFRPRVFKTVRSVSDNGNSRFRIQSTGINLSSLYSIGKFYISPQYYFDYYLPNDLSDGEKRATSVFTISIGVSF